jgi:hypothetical protein
MWSTYPKPKVTKCKKQKRELEYSHQVRSLKSFFSLLEKKKVDGSYAVTDCQTDSKELKFKSLAWIKNSIKKKKEIENIRYLQQ